MVSLPDNVRPYATTIAKHHFWILAALVPVVLVPLLMVGNAGLRSRITARRSQIESKLSQARAVTGVAPHPNAGWSGAIDASTGQVRQETLDEWRRFWHSQQRLRVWPKELGDDFLAAVAALPPGGKLARPYLVRYQNTVRQLVRQLPARMGVEEAMRDDEARRRAAELAVPEPGRVVTLPVLTWNPSDQRRLYDSFVWDRPPLTSQVLLAQEELWVYGLFCDLLARFTRGATGGHDSPLTVVDELAVGFPAAVRGEPGAAPIRRILLPAATPAAGGAGLPMEEPRTMESLPGGEGQASAPWHPRFTGNSGRAAGPMPGFEGVPADPSAKAMAEDDFLGWIYVDFDGKPLSSAELAANPSLQLVHLMPFVLRVVVDQRHLDRLLATLAAMPIPIDVREVRVNAGSTATAMDRGESTDMPAVAPGDETLRRYDIRLELRGTVGLATPPNEQVLGATTPAAEAGS